MDGPNYGRTVTLTQESLTAMGERQAKQKALKEELDRQIMERRQLAEGRGGVDTTGMSKAQKKLLELQELRKQQQQPPQVHQSQSLPANFSLGALQQQQQPNGSMFPDVNQRSGGTYQMQQNFGGAPGAGAYDMRSLPANLGSMMPPSSPMSSGAVNTYSTYAQPQSQLYPTAQNYLSQQDPNGGYFNPQSNAQGWNGAQPGRSQSLPLQNMPTQGPTLTSPTFSQGGGGYNNQGMPTGVSSPHTYTSSPPPHPQQQQQQTYTAPRQVFTLDDVMGFAKMATDAPPAQSTGNTYNNGYTPRDDPNQMVHSPPVSVAGDDAGYGRNGGGVPPRGVPPPPSVGTKGPHAGHAKAKTPAVVGSGAARGALAGTPSNNGPGANGGVAGSRARGHSPGAGTARAPSSGGGGGGVAKDKHMLNKVERLQKELESREQQMQKMMEKNRNWEAQAQQLQTQLKEEKKRNKALVPTRAETAPQPAPTAPPKKLDPIVRPTNAAPGKTRPKPVAVGGPLSPNDGRGEVSSGGGGGGGNPLSHFPLTSPKSTVLAKNTFEATEQRPITAPDVLDPTSHLLRSGHLPPIQRPSQPSSTLVKQPMPAGDGTSLSMKPKGPSVANGGGLGAKAPPSLQYGHFHSDKSPANPAFSSTGGEAFSLNSTVSPRKKAAAAGTRGAGGGGGGTLLAKDVREALKGTEFEAQMAMEEETNCGGVRYMGDPSAVLEEEERVMKMMGSKASNFAFHSRRGDVEYATTANNKRRSNNTNNNRDLSNNESDGNDEAEVGERRGGPQGRQASKPPKHSRARYGGDATSDTEVGEVREREEEVEEEVDVDADECVDDNDYNTASSVSFTIEHLQWFSGIQLITAQQCRRLWAFLSGCDPDLVPVEHVIPEGYEDVASASDYSSDDGGEEEEEGEEQLYEEDGEECYGGNALREDGESGADDEDDDDYAYVSDAHGVVHKASPNGRHYDDNEGGGDYNDNDNEEDRYDDEFDAETKRRALQHTRSPVPPSGSADSSRHHRRPSIQQGQRQRAPSKPF